MARRPICRPWAPCGAAVLILFTVFAAAPRNTLNADESGLNASPIEKVEDDEGVATAAMAIQLAMMGQQQKSPLLMLAAADLLGGLRASERESKAVVVKEPESDEEPSPMQVNVQAWLRQAREYSQGDPALEALVEETPRGLVYRQGHNLPDARIAGHHFKVLTTDYLNPGQSLRMENVIFEAKKPAVVAVIGDGNGDLDLWVYCGGSGGEIGKDVDATSTCVVQWMPRWEGPFTILIRNVGRGREKFVVLANW